MLGEVMKKYKHAGLPDGGNAFRETIARVKAENPVSVWNGPSVAIAWDKDLGLPLFDDSRGYPALLVEFPQEMKDACRCDSRHKPVASAGHTLRLGTFCNGPGARGEEYRIRTFGG